jgi:hypothetical protein
MGTDKFHAETQYSDLAGSIAADRSDVDSIEHWLDAQGLVRDGEHFVGMKLFTAQLSASNQLFVRAIFLMAPDEVDLRVRLPGVDEPPTIVVRKIERELQLSEVFGFFKQLEFTLSADGEFEERNYTLID